MNDDSESGTPDSRPGDPSQTLGTLLREMESLAAGARELTQAIPGRQRLHLSSPGAWLDLQEATYSERFAEQLPEASIEQLRRLCAHWQRHWLKLSFVTSTRPVWNT